MSYLERAITDGHAKLTGEGKQQKILYVAVNHNERYADPEEQVRAEFWAELIYRYGYEPARIGVEITVPDRTPSDRADLVVFRDDERKKPYAVIECKADGVTDAEFNQAVEQACGNGAWAKFRANYVGVGRGHDAPPLVSPGNSAVGARGEHHRRFAAPIRQAGGIPFLQGRPEQRHPARQQGIAHRRDQEMPPDPLGGRQALATGGFMNLMP
jgi:hypothetical protein